MTERHFQIHRFDNGQVSLVDTRYPSAESMHSKIGPWEEAQRVYLEQTQLPERLQATDTEPLVLFDIGFGIGANALAAFEAFFSGKRSLNLFSFETDLGGLRTVMSSAESYSEFDFVARNQAILSALLQYREFSCANSLGFQLNWHLLEGDFRENIEKCPAPEVLFFDLYSPKNCADLWGYQTFRRLKQKMTKSPQDAVLSTYCSATSVRSALLLAGWEVGYGLSTSAKKETTQAALHRSVLAHPLDPAWFERRSRSSKPYPPDWPPQKLDGA